MVTSKAQVERGHDSPFVRQFSVFLPNRVGQLNELLEMLASTGVEVAGISVVDSTEWAVVRMVFTEPDKAREVLARRQVAFTECAVLGLVLSEPQTLLKACKAMVEAELNVRFAYPLLVQHAGRPVVVLHVDDEVVAIQVLRKHGFVLLDHEGP